MGNSKVAVSADLRSAHASPKAASHAAPLAVDSSVNALQVQVVTDLFPAGVSPADQNDAGTRVAALPVLRRGGDVNAVDTLARLVTQVRTTTICAVPKEIDAGSNAIVSMVGVANGNSNVNVS